MNKTVRDSDIAAIKCIYSAYENKENLITMQCKKFKLTSEFMQAFSQYVTEEAFSRSPDLDYDLLVMYDEFFDMDYWVESSVKALDPLLKTEFVERLGKDRIDEAIKKTNPNRISANIFDSFKDRLDNDTKIQVVNKSKLSEDREFIIKNAEYLTSDIFKNRTVRAMWDESLINEIFANKTLTVKFVLSALDNIKDIFFIERVLTDTSLRYKETNDTFNVVLKNFINKISENQIGSLFDLLTKYNPSAFTYEILKYVLKMKDYLTEDFLMENLELFLQNALFNDIVKYARFRDYMNLLVLLKLNDQGQDEEEY